MKLSMTLTLEGLIRALRIEAQRLADAIESQDLPDDFDNDLAAVVDRRLRHGAMMGAGDDRGRD